jgi:UDP-N-acetylenolpyruvoylglucosamine reductase
MSSPTVPPTPARSPRPGPDDVLVARLRERLAGELSLPGDPGYALATPWNVAIERTPRAVVAAADAGDVVETVRFAGEHGLRVAVQRTGHGAVPLEGDDVLLVHTARLDECRIDAQGRRARVGAGVLVQELVDAAAPHGLGPLTGSATTVGVAGFVTGGGIGPLSRTFGAITDHVRRLDVVTGDGRLLSVTAEQHPDLFWGLRGGKATLGIVTAVELDLLPLDTVHGGALYFDGADARRVLHAWRAWSAGLPEHANTSFALLQLPPMPGVPEPLAGRLTAAVRFTSVAAREEAQAVLAPLRQVAPTVFDTVDVLPYPAISAVHADPVEPMPVLESSGLLRELPEAAVDRLLALAGPGSGSPQTVVELRLLGGALGRPPAVPAAAGHRDAAYSLLTIGVLAPPVAAGVTGHALEVEAGMREWSTGGALPNFGASADPLRNARCYDADTARRLAALADHHDRLGVLRVGQVVRAGRAA